MLRYGGLVFSVVLCFFSTYVCCDVKVYERKTEKISQLARPRLDLGDNEKLFFSSFSSMDSKRPRGLFLVV